ncbi:MAG: SDR family NAD(P)-dependent oxidoreductase [Candidatus Micrarchaeia archaeon]
MTSDLLNKEFTGKKILVTGGAGSIGSELVKCLLKYDPEVIRILDINETGLFELEQHCGGNENKIRMLIGDIRDKNRVTRAMQGIDFVFHAAALKHVYINEYTPSEAINTNVIGTQNVINAAIENNVYKMITISTDKAVNPTSVMGTTKLLAEKITSAAEYYRGTSRTVFASVRFGNVLISRGSVIPLFLNQISLGGPVTITDPKMTRFIIPTDKAIELILQATAFAKGGETFILRMPSVKILEMAEVLIELYGPKYGYLPDKIKIKTIGAKMGEKIHESLLTDYEKMHARVVDGKLIVIDPLIRSLRGLESDKNEKAFAEEGSTLNTINNKSDIKTLTKDEIRKLLLEVLK